MKFEKKLVIMMGSSEAKGTASLERNGYGTFATVSVYNAPDLKNGEYYFGIRSSAGTFTRALGSLGRSSSRFKIEDINMEDCHIFIFESLALKVIMYGATSDKKLWEGNLIDGIRREDFEAKSTNNNIKTQDALNALPNYSARSPKVEASSLFWDIVPPLGGYRDDTIAEVNYYPSNLTFSKAEKGEATANGKSEAMASVLSKTEKNEFMTNGKSEVAASVASRAEKGEFSQNSSYILPSEMERRYLFRYRQEENFSKPIHILENEPQKEQEGGSFSRAESVPDSETPLKKAETKVKTPEDEAQIKRAETRVKTPEEEKKQDKPIPPPSAFTAQDAVKTARTKTRFYERASKQIEELFRTNPRCEELERLMPSTKWVRVEFNSSGKYYVVGLIGATPDYLCYGVPANYSATPPIELEGYSAFLPINPARPQSSGYWLMYQDATTGESVPSIPKRL